MDCLEDGKSLKGSEPDLESEEESSGDEDEDTKMPPLRSSSGTSISGDNEDDEVKSEHVVEAHEDDAEPVKCPIVKSWNLPMQSLEVTAKEQCPKRAGGDDDGAKLKECLFTSRCSPDEEGFQIHGRVSLEGGLLNVLEDVGAETSSQLDCGERGKKMESLGEEGFTKALEKAKALELEDGARQPVLPKPGSQCLPGRKGKGMDAGSTGKGVEGSAKGLKAGAKEVEARTKEVEALPKHVEARAKEVQVGAKAVEAGAKAVEAGAKVVDDGAKVSGSSPTGVETVRSPFKKKAKRVKGPSVSDDMETEHESAIENVYSANKTTYKELSAIAGGSGSPVLVPESNVRTRARAAKEVEQPAENSPPLIKVKGKKGEKGKVDKVGGALSQKRRRGAT